MAASNRGVALGSIQKAIIVLVFFGVSVALLIAWLFLQRSQHGRSKMALRTSEERYFLALAGSTDGLWDWDLLTNTVFYSDRFREILRYSSEEFPGRIDSFRSRLHPEDAEVIWAAIERHLQDRVPYTGSNTACRRNRTITDGFWQLIITPNRV